MSNILKSIIPQQVSEVCVDPSPVNCGEVTSDITDATLKIEFPRGGQNSKLPMAGGAVISIRADNLKLTPTDNVKGVVTRKLSRELSGLELEPTLEGLSSSRVKVNKSLFKIANRNLKVVSDNAGNSRKKKAPFIYISSFVGTDSSKLRDGTYSSDLARLCELRYIPFDSFKVILDNLLDSSRGFGDVVGVAGRTYSAMQKQLSNGAQSLIPVGGTNPDVVDLVLEFFPVVNISGEALLSTVSKPVVGGYYTILDGVIYIKMPDLSGRDSAGISEGYLNSSSELWIEILSDSSISRVPIKNFKMPPTASFVGEQPTELPGENLEITFEVSEDEDLEVYLSPIVRNQSLNKSRGIESFSRGIELFSVPLLTRPIQDGAGRIPIISENSSPSSDLSSIAGGVVPYYPEFLSLGDYKDPASTGYPYLGPEMGISPHSFYGEKNRPEIILSEDGLTSAKNEKRYYNLSAYGAINLLSSVMPRFYSGVPSKWIKANAKPKSSKEYVATFKSSLFADLDIESNTHKGVIEYAVYISDSLGQVTRVGGKNIKLVDALPQIDKITPDGFSDEERIVFGNNTIIEIKGSNLKNIQKVSFIERNSGSVVNVTLSESIISQPREDSITITLKDLDFGVKGFIPDAEYEVIAYGSGENLLSNRLPINIASTDISDLPKKKESLFEFKVDEFSSTSFGSDPIIGIPLFKSGKSAEIGLKSRTRVFKAGRGIHAYIGLKNTAANRSRLNEFSFDEDIIEFKSNDTGESFLIPVGIGYELFGSNSTDFHTKSLFGKRASLSFPGKTYSRYNFSSLIGVDSAYIIITNRNIKDLITGSKVVSLGYKDHGIVSLGGKNTKEYNSPAFIEPSTVLGVAANISGSIESTFSSNDFILPSNVFAKDISTPSVISTPRKISRLAIIVSGISERFLRKRYNIKLGGSSIMKYLSKRPELIGAGQLLFLFDDVVVDTEGLLPITVDKVEKSFGNNYSSSGYSAQGTILADNSFEINEDGELLVNSDLSNAIGSVTPVSNALDLLYPQIGGSGVIYNPNFKGKANSLNSFTPLSLKPSAKLELAINNSGRRILPPNATESKVYTLARDVLVVKSGAVFGGGRYKLNSDKSKALLFFDILTDGFSSIKYKVPSVVSIAPEGGEHTLISSGKEIRMKVGKRYEVIVENSVKDFVLILGNSTIRPRVTPEQTGGIPGRYKAVFEAPGELIGEVITADKCFDICASTENSRRSLAKGQLGRDFVLNIESTYQGLLNGSLKDKTPDLQALKRMIESFPLRIASIPLNKANTPKDLAKTFCDMSFSLTGDLKIALNGFQLLMTPIQVIFCIVDVICSLLNPKKLAKAVVRLFQCLYDLVLLLPQISVPVMYFQIAIHTLELIQCVSEKLLHTIHTINKISGAINTSRKEGNFSEVKSLEESLFEHLYDFEMDLDFLGPIVDILDIFIQLLQLAFRFPCSVTPGSGEPDCGVDGTMLAGIVADVAAPDLVILPETMLPVGQTYTEDSLGSTSSGSTLFEPSEGDMVSIASGGTFLDSMKVDPDSLRGTSEGVGSINFNATFAPTYTKGVKRSGSPSKIVFEFKGRGGSTTLNSKNIDPNQTVDTPLALMSRSGSTISISKKGNIYSPIDGSEFLNVLDSTASVKPLVLKIESPIFEIDSSTGLKVQTGVETLTRTFDNIPKLAIMDDEFNLYFISKNGIEFDNGGFVTAITAEIVNQSSSPKMKLSREVVEVDGESLNLYDFPQIYFFDMRLAGDRIQEFCSTSSINSFLFEENNTVDIEDVVARGKNCLQEYTSNLSMQVSTIRDAQQKGDLLPVVSTIDLSNLKTTAEECLGGTIDDICKYVVNGLNTSFKIREDNEEVAKDEFVDGTLAAETLSGFDEVSPDFTGAREYAAGIGDSGTVLSGSVATIDIIPRDSYDIEIGGDLANRITLEIISDETGSADFVRDDAGVILSKNGNVYTAKLTSDGVGEVMVVGRICDRTIQALTYEGMQSNAPNNTQEVDCVQDMSGGGTGVVVPIGSLTKVDRVLSVFFVQSDSSSLRNVSGVDSDVLMTQPQKIGTRLEN